jgi:hypothetical protein
LQVVTHEVYGPWFNVQVLTGNAGIRSAQAYQHAKLSQNLPETLSSCITSLRFADGRYRFFNLISFSIGMSGA